MRVFAGAFNAQGEKMVFDQVVRVTRAAIRLRVFVTESGGCRLERQLKDDDGQLKDNAGMSVTFSFIIRSEEELFDMVTADEYYSELRTQYEAIQAWFSRTPPATWAGKRND